MPRGILSSPWTLPEEKLVMTSNYDTILSNILLDVDATN
jgi:hypothetical protein